MLGLIFQIGEILLFPARPDRRDRCRIDFDKRFFLCPSWCGDMPHLGYEFYSRLRAGRDGTVADGIDGSGIRWFLAIFVRRVP